MPRLTSRVFTDLAIWMVGFGLVIGVVFPPFCLLLGLPAERVMTPLFFASTLVAGVVGDQRVGVTVSLGGATFRDSSDSTDSLIALADRALYDAKEDGRDRLVVA